MEQAYGGSEKWRGTPPWSSCSKHPSLQRLYMLKQSESEPSRVSNARKLEVLRWGREEALAIVNEIFCQIWPSASPACCGRRTLPASRVPLTFEESSVVLGYTKTDR